MEKVTDTIWLEKTQDGTLRFVEIVEEPDEAAEEKDGKKVKQVAKWEKVFPASQLDDAVARLK